MPPASTSNRKAFESRSLSLRVLQVTVAVVLLIALAGVGVRFLLTNQWNKGAGWVKGKLDAPLMGLFQKLGKRYVEASDLDRDAKLLWASRMDGLAGALQEGKGTQEQRDRLRAAYDGISEKMKDGALSRSELEPFEKPLDETLGEVAAVEAKKKE